MALRQQAIKRENESLRKQCDDLAVLNETLHELITGLLMQCEVIKDPGDRISAYRYDNGEFVLIGRYSLHHDRKKPGKRTRYPSNEGVIGEAWESDIGACFIKNLPDFEKVGVDQYLEATSKRGKSISKESLEGMRMKSRSYTAMRVQDIAGDDMAVVVAESMNPRTFGAKIESTEDFLGPTTKILQRVLHTLRRYEPSATESRRRGY